MFGKVAKTELIWQIRHQIVLLITTPCAVSNKHTIPLSAVFSTPNSMIRPVSISEKKFYSLNTNFLGGKSEKKGKTNLILN